MRKIAFIGGGSAKFVFELTRDLFTFEPLRDAHIALMDLDAERVGRAEQLVRKVIADLGLAASVESTLDQRRALDGADYVVLTIMVGGFRHYESDGAIPARYGVLPTVGDTVGPGGVFRLVRTAPVLREIARNLREVAPGALLLNYANPMAMNTWVLLDEGHARTVGLCHSIQYMARVLAEWLNLPPGEVRYTAGGINHVDFYLTLAHRGRDLYPDLLARRDEVLARHPEERVRFELLEHLGYWPAEGPHHQSEYYPWFRKDAAAADRYAVESFWGLNHDKEMNRLRTAEVADMIDGRRPIPRERSLEYGAHILHAVEAGEPLVFYGNVRNEGLIENLPADAVVEVPCCADAAGVRPCRVGRIPPQLAAAMTPHIHVHRLAVEAVARRDRRLLCQAIQADPLTGAILTLPRIRQMVDELAEENRDYLRDWA